MWLCLCSPNWSYIFIELVDSLYKFDSRFDKSINMKKYLSGYFLYKPFMIMSFTHFDSSISNSGVVGFGPK